MRELASGHRTIQIPAVTMADEIGEMARTVLVFQQAMTEADRLRIEQEEAKERETQDRKKHWK